MPKVNRSIPKPSTNGHAKIDPNSQLGRALAKRRGPGTDDIEIGSDDLDEDDELGTVLTMADLIKQLDGIRFLVKDWIPFAMLSVVIAPPGMGKSLFVLYGLVRAIITGSKWFNGMKGPTNPGHVIWCDTEGSGGITGSRVTDWKLPAERILLLDKADPFKSVDIQNLADIERLEALVNRYKTKLVVIDSLRGSHGGDENNSSIVKVMQNLSRLAERTKAAVVLVHHTRKLGDGEEISADSCRGSNGIVAMARSLIGIDKPDPGSDWVRLQILKENLGIRPQPIGLLVGPGMPHPEFGPAPEKPRKEKPETGHDKAETWLRSRMEPGRWYPASDLKREGEALGFSATGTLQKARESLGIVKPDCLRKNGKGWEWMLPETSESSSEQKKESGQEITEPSGN